MKKFRTLSIGVVAAGSLIAASCTTVNPYTGEEQTSNKVKGTAIGAVAGGVLGVLAGDDHESAVIGAISGAAIGFGVGQYMDYQEELIRRELEGTGVTVSRVGDNLVLNMPSDITFSKGKSTLDSKFTSSLGGVAKIFEKYKKTKLTVIGHTDSDGGTSYNQNLSEARSNAVADYLNARGLEGNRIITSGRGEAQPVATNATSAGRAQNRRVEVHVAPQNEQF